MEGVRGKKEGGKAVVIMRTLGLGKPFINPIEVEQSQDIEESSWCT